MGYIVVKESISITVDPSIEQIVIEEYQEFGWELVSSQVVNNILGTKTNKLGYTRVLENEKEQYVKLVFSRDTEMLYYNEFAQLFNQFKIEYPKEKRSFKTLCLQNIMLCIIGVVLGIMGSNILVGIFIAFIIAIFVNISYKKEKTKYKEIYEKVKKQKEEAIQRARELRSK